MMELHPVVLSGGSGTRLWPLSREHHSRQCAGFLASQILLAAFDALSG
jgi:mannose-1-phosphate guanylyltransferase/mannose-6-phosphate isomerase